MPMLVSVSFSPGFSPVREQSKRENRFNGFSSVIH
jgi:hypothetical protein